MNRWLLLAALLFASGASAQETLDDRALFKQLQPYRAYGEVVKENKDKPYVRVQFGAAPKSADVAAIVKIVQQSTLPVYLNFNQNPNIDDAAVAALKGADKLIGVGLGGTKITDEGMKTLPTLPNLEEVYIASEDVTNAGLAHVAELTKLRKLSVYSKKVTNAGYVHLKKLVNLEELNVGDVFGLDDSCFEAMKGMTKLREVRAGKNKITDAGLAHLSGMTGLKKLWLDIGTDNKKVTAAGFKALQNLKNVEELSILSSSVAVTPEAFIHIGAMTALKDITIVYSGSPDAKASVAFKTLPELKKLRLDSVREGTLEGLRGHKTLETLDLTYSFAEDKAFAPLLEITSLKNLYISNTRITDAGLKHFAKLANLKYLSLSNTAITDAGLRELQPLTSLETLSVSECKLTGSGLKDLVAMPKLKSLSVSGNPIKDEALLPLHTMTQLAELNLTGTKVNDEATIALLKAIPKMRIRDVTGDDVVLNPKKVERKPMGEDVSAKEPHFKLTAADFHAEYKKNSQTAAAKYKKKIIELSGEVSGMGTNISGEAYLTLKVADDFIGVMCIARDALPWAKALPGQTVKIKGEWPEYSFAAALINCCIVEAGPAKHVELTATEFSAIVVKEDNDALEKKYKDKYLVLSGKVVDKEFNSVGAGTITLETPGKPVVKCSFTAFDKSGVKAMKVGDTVRVAGQYTLNFGKDDVSIYFCVRMPDKK